jgi:hypothetical protein
MDLIAWKNSNASFCYRHTGVITMTPGVAVEKKGAVGFHRDGDGITVHAGWIRLLYVSVSDDASFFHWKPDLGDDVIVKIMSGVEICFNNSAGRHAVIASPSSRRSCVGPTSIKEPDSLCRGGACDFCKVELHCGQHSKEDEAYCDSRLRERRVWKQRQHNVVQAFLTDNDHAELVSIGGDSLGVVRITGLTVGCFDSLIETHTGKAATITTGDGSIISLKDMGVPINEFLFPIDAVIREAWRFDYVREGSPAADMRLFQRGDTNLVSYNGCRLHGQWSRDSNSGFTISFHHSGGSRRRVHIFRKKNDATWLYCEDDPRWCVELTLSTKPSI